MNIEEQRKAFEVYAIKTEYNLSKNQDGEYGVFNTIHAWHGWLAAQNQEGYVVVPVEANDDILLLMCDEVCADFNGMKMAYKAMIEEARK